MSPIGHIRAEPGALTFGVLAAGDDCGFAGVIYWGQKDARAYALALAKRAGPILPLITTQPDEAVVLQQRHLCVDTTAAGGNAALLSG